MKNFDIWNQEKQNIENLFPQERSFHEREIWWCSIGLNVGDEQDGKNEWFERPVLVIKKFNRRLAWIIPMTTQPKQGKYYHSMTYDNFTSILILSQLRLISSKRFRRFVRKISDAQFKKIKGKIINLLAL